VVEAIRPYDPPVDPFLPITTPRLRLRTFAPADAPAFAAYRSDTDVARYQSWRAPYALADAERFVAEMAACTDLVLGDWVQIAVERDGALAGDVAVGMDADGRVATIGYTLAPASQGRGLAHEAVGAVVDALFARRGVHRVEASIDARNVASARLLESSGFELESCSPAAVWDDGEWIDDVRYGIDRDHHDAWAARPRSRPSEVRLVEITAATARAVMALLTQPNQQRFVAPVAASYADALFPASVDGAPVVPWLRAVEADGELAGFVMLTEVTAHHPVPYLWRLLVDRRHQRRGVGSRVVELLAARLRADGHTALLVRWRPGPGGPEPFYLRQGFVRTGVEHDGEIEGRLGLTAATT
jgi:RimJ/RimL family protein N-acetyltransferase